MRLVPKTANALMVLNVIFAAALITANVVASKVVQVWGLVTTSGFLAYAITFLITDIIDEIWGEKEARKTIMFGFYAQATASAIILSAQFMPVAPFAKEQQAHFLAILGQNWRFVIASMVAYFASQFHDVKAFMVWGRLTKGKHKWMRNNFSTMVSQFIDTAIFITIAFYGVVPDLWHMIVSQYILKLIIALCDTPFFYLFTKGYVFGREVDGGKKDKAYSSAH